MATPAVNPVTAGKKIANKTIKSGELGADVSATSVALKSLFVVIPINIERMESAMAPRIKNCVLIAIEVLI